MPDAGNDGILTQKSTMSIFVSRDLTRWVQDLIYGVGLLKKQQIKSVSLFFTMESFWRDHGVDIQPFVLKQKRVLTSMSIR